MLNQIKKSFNLIKERNWDHMYYAFDIHETILIPDYNNLEPLRFYPYAKETLQLISQRTDIISIIYTCSHREEINSYQMFFKKNGITFKYVNENPEVLNTRLGCFDTKFYFNCLFDDKSGFDATTEWEEIYNYFLELKKQLNK